MLFRSDQKTVTRDDLAQHFEKNAPKIEETVLGGKIDPAILRKRQEIADMYFPEIKRYRNMGDLTHKDHHPDEMIRKAAVARSEEIQDKMWEHMDTEAPLPDLEPTKYKDWTLGNKFGNETPSQRGYREVLLRLDHPDTLHQSSHWDQPNVIAHLRMQDRGPDNNILHLEEVQSDWAQQGREQGFRDPKKEKAYFDFCDNLRSKYKIKVMNTDNYKNLEKEIGPVNAESFADELVKELESRDLERKFPEEKENIQALRAAWMASTQGLTPAPYVTNTDQIGRAHV